MTTAKTTATKPRKSAAKTASNKLEKLVAADPGVESLLNQMLAAATAAGETSPADAAAAGAVAGGSDTGADAEYVAKLAELDAKLAKLDDTIAEAETAKAKASKVVAKAAKAKNDPVIYVEQDVKRDRVSGDVLTGRQAGVWPAKFGVTPDKFSDKRPTWINAEIVRTILDNLVDARAILKRCDAANSAE